MSGTAKHKFVSGIPDDPNSAIIRPQHDWNDEHVFANGSSLTYLMWDSLQSDKVVFDNIWARFPEIDLSKPPYSVDMTGVVDASETINNAISTIGPGGRFRFPQGFVRIDNPIFLEAKTGVSIHGAFGGTQFRWLGQSTGSMFVLRGCSECELDSFSIVSEAPMSAGVFCDTSPLATSTRNTFRRLYIDGSLGGLNYGFVNAAITGGDVGNDLMSYYECTVIGYRVAGWAFTHPSSRGNSLNNCRVFGLNNGSVGFAAAAFSIANAPAGTGGTFNAYGCSGGGNTIADFYLYGGGEHNIIGGYFKGSQRLLICDDITGTHNFVAPTLISGIRWEQDNIATDKYAIFFRESGPLTLIGNTFGVGVPGYATDVKIYTFNSSLGIDGPGSGYLSLGNFYQNNIDPSPFAGLGVSCSVGDIWSTQYSGVRLQNLAIQEILTANLPPAGSANNGRLLFESTGGVPRLIVYTNGQRFPVTLGAPF